MATPDIRVEDCFSDYLFEGKPSDRSTPLSNYYEITCEQDRYHDRYHDRHDDPNPNANIHTVTKALQALESDKDKEVYRFKLKPFESEAHDSLNQAIEQFEVSNHSTSTARLVKNASDSSYLILMKIKYSMSDVIQMEIDGRIVTVSQSKSLSNLGGKPRKNHYQATLDKSSDQKDHSKKDHSNLKDEILFEDSLEGFSHSFMLADFVEFEAVELSVKDSVLVMLIENSGQINKY